MAARGPRRDVFRPSHIATVTSGGCVMLAAVGTQMEHRWGERVLMDQPARLDARPNLIAVGRLRNASLSGGYVETGASVPLGTRLHVELEWIYWSRTEQCRVPAYVVRSDENGLGLEWCDFAPRWIALVITAHSPTSYGARDGQLPVSVAAKRNLVDPEAHHAYKASAGPIAAARLRSRSETNPR